jgi:hypothetical protein
MGRWSSLLTDLVMVVQRWEEIPHSGLYTPEVILYWKEDVAKEDDWRTHRDDMQCSPLGMPPLAPWKLGI